MFKTVLSALSLGMLLSPLSAKAQYPDMQPTGRIEILTYGDARFGIDTEHLKVASGRSHQSYEQAAIASYYDDDLVTVAYRQPAYRSEHVQTVAHRRPMSPAAYGVGSTLVRPVSLSRTGGHAMGHSCPYCRSSADHRHGYHDPYGDALRRLEQEHRMGRLVRVGY